MRGSRAIIEVDEVATRFERAVVGGAVGVHVTDMATD